MRKLLLKLFSKENLWRELLRREGFASVDEVANQSIWQQVFHKVPELKDVIKRRELILLQNSALGDKPSDFILGQLAENRMIRRYDVPMGAELKVDLKAVEEKIPDRKNFLDKWKNATRPKKESGVTPSVS